MKLTLFTDYSLRVLLYLGARGDRLASIGEIARGYGVSQNHLMKVVNELVRGGHVESVRGRSGGLRLARQPNLINVGDLVRRTEGHQTVVDCGSCAIGPACGLTGVFNEALAAFFAVLDRYTLADLLARPTDFSRLFGDLAPSPRKVEA